MLPMGFFLISLCAACARRSGHLYRHSRFAGYFSVGTNINSMWAFDVKMEDYLERYWSIPVIIPSRTPLSARRASCAGKIDLLGVGFLLSVVLLDMQDSVRGARVRR